MKKVKEIKIKKAGFKKYIKHSIPLYIMLVIPLLYIIIFKYAPLGGIALAFNNTIFFRESGRVRGWD